MGGLNPVGHPSSASSSTSSNPRFTPISYGSDEEIPESGPSKSHILPLRVQTNFQDHPDAGDPLSDIENESRYNESEELEGKLPNVGPAPEYTPEEEEQVVRRFDRRLVPFLALLYLLSFLDRSSTPDHSAVRSKLFSCKFTDCAPRYRECEDCRTYG